MYCSPFTMGMGFGLLLVRAWNGCLEERTMLLFKDKSLAAAVARRSVCT